MVRSSVANKGDEAGRFPGNKLFREGSPPAERDPGHTGKAQNPLSRIGKGKLPGVRIPVWDTVISPERSACECAQKGWYRGLMARPFSGAGRFLFQARKGKVKGMKEQAICVVCECAIDFAPGTLKGEILVCPDCGTELEVVCTTPPGLAEAPQVEEDWGE